MTHVIKLQNEFETEKLELSKKLRTAKLQYWILDSVCRLHCHSKDVHQSRKNCTMTWTMRLEFAYKMLNLFAGTGHLNYVKIARLYLQIMLNLHVDHLWLFEQFRNGSHSI